MNQKGEKTIWTAILALMGILTILFLILPKHKYSEQENRYLEALPEIAAGTLYNGSFMSDLETYTSDHFPFRDLFMTLHTWQQRLMGKNQINGIYLCEDGYYIERYEKPMNTERIIAAFRRLEENVTDASVSFLLAPTAVTVYADKLPKTAVNDSQTEEIARIYDALSSQTIDVNNMLNVFLSQKNEYQLYYRLDHHWTSYGAYFAYRAYCEANAITPREMDAFTMRVVTDEFRGTIYSKLNDTFAGKDSITVLRQDDLHVSVNYIDTGEVTDTLYAEKYLQEKDKYSYFLNNIHPMIEITNHNADCTGELVVVKDSYANCMIPFLVNHYAKIYVVDTRYYKQSVTEFINNHTNVTNVLVLYNMNTIDHDLGIGGIY